MLSCQLFSPANGPAPVGTGQSQGSSGQLVEATAQPQGTSGSPAGPSYQNAQNPPDAHVVWFTQDASNPQNVYYCVTYTSHDASQAQFSSTFEISAYNSAGNELGQSTDMVGWIYPGQELTTAGEIDLNSSGTVARLELKAEDPGTLAPAHGGKGNPLSAENASFAVIGGLADAVGTIQNSMDQTLMGVNVVALALDASGKIIDAAQTNLAFLPAMGQSVVEVNMHIKDAPAKVELVPGLAGNAEFVDQTSSPITVEKAGALLGAEGSLQAVFVLRNSASRGYAGAYYNASLYDSQGNAVASDDDVLPFFFPLSRLAYVVSIPIPDGAFVSKIVVQVQPVPDSDAPSPAAAQIKEPNPLVPSQVEFKPQENKVTVLLTNTSKEDIENVSAVAVLYNAAGQIVGGGENSDSNLPASAKMQLDIPVLVIGDAAHVVAHTEVIPYGSPASLSSAAGAQPTSPSGGQSPSSSSVLDAEILAQWFEQPSGDRTEVDWAFQMANPNPSLELQNVGYQVTAYDSSGLTLKSIDGTIGLVPIGQPLGVAGSIQLSSPASVGKVDISITSPGQPLTPTSAQLPLLIGQANYVHYPGWDMVTGTVDNTENQEMNGVSFDALVFDKNDLIVGGGESISNFIPAGSKIPVVVPVATTGEGVRVELYPDISSSQAV